MYKGIISILFVVFMMLSVSDIVSAEMFVVPQPRVKADIKELGENISSNGGTQLNVTPYHADGTEGNLITGLDFINGKSGIDGYTESLVILSEEEHENHKGFHFRAHIDSSLGDGDSLFVYFPPADTTRLVHLTFIIEGSFITSAHLYEAPTLADSANVFTPICTNRENPQVSTRSIYFDVVATDFGFELDGAKAGGATGPGNNTIFGGENRSEDEWVFRQNTGYLFIIASFTAANLTNSKLSWIESIPLN